MKKLIYYWSPCLNKVATVKATINSALSLSKYSKDYDVKIINVCGEWNNYKSYLQANNIGLEKLSFDYYNFLYHFYCLERFLIHLNRRMYI